MRLKLPLPWQTQPSLFVMARIVPYSSQGPMPPITAPKTKHWSFSTHALSRTPLPGRGRVSVVRPRLAPPQAPNKLCQRAEISQRGGGTTTGEERESLLKSVGLHRQRLLQQMIALNTPPFTTNPPTHTLCPCQAESSNPNNPSIVEKSNSA